MVVRLNYIYSYPFGSVLGGRNGNTSVYRYSFQNQETDAEVKGAGNSVNFEYRMHDPRLGRFLSIDPLAADYPHNSPYAFSENSTVAFIELEGLEKFYAVSGEFLGRIGSGKSDEIRITNLSYDEGVKAFDRGDYEDYLMKNSRIALKLDQENRMIDDWANENRAESTLYERAMVIFSNQIDDGHGEKTTVLLGGYTVGGQRTTVDAYKSKLKIGKETIAEDKTWSAGVVGGTDFISKGGWKRHSVLHTHTTGTSKDFSYLQSGIENDNDIVQSLSLGIPITLIHHDNTKIKTFFPKVYTDLFKKVYPNRSVFEGTPDKELIDKATITR